MLPIAIVFWTSFCFMFGVYHRIYAPPLNTCSLIMPSHSLLVWHQLHSIHR